MMTLNSKSVQGENHGPSYQPDRTRLHRRDDARHDRFPRLDRRRLGRAVLAIRRISRRFAPPSSARWRGWAGEFAKRNAKIIGISVDPVASHDKWKADIKTATGHSVEYPLIGDSDLKVAKLYDMLPEDAGDSSEGRTPADNATVRSVYVDRSRQEDQADADLSDDDRPQFPGDLARDRFHSARRPSTRWRRPPTGNRART